MGPPFTKLGFAVSKQSFIRIRKGPLDGLWHMRCRCGQKWSHPEWNKVITAADLHLKDHAYPPVEIKLPDNPFNISVEKRRQNPAYLGLFSLLRQMEDKCVSG